VSRSKRYLLVAYDIVDDNKRKMISDELKYYGLERFQYSVFMGYLEKTEVGGLASSLKKFNLDDEDKIYMFTICSRCFEQKIMIGNEPSTLEKEHLIL